MNFLQYNIHFSTNYLQIKYILGKAQPVYTRYSQNGHAELVSASVMFEILKLVQGDDVYNI